MYMSSVHKWLKSGKTYIILYKQGCPYSMEAKRTVEQKFPDDNICVETSDQKEEILTALKKVFQKCKQFDCSNNSLLSTHSTYPIILKKENNKYKFIGGNSEFQTEIGNIMYGGGRKSFINKVPRYTLIKNGSFFRL